MGLAGPGRPAVRHTTAAWRGDEIIQRSRLTKCRLFFVMDESA
jgi:hypothetical protein